MRNIIKIVGGFALLWYGILRGASAMIVKLYSWSLNNINFDDHTLEIQLNIFVKNPLWVGLTIEGIKGDVYLNGEKVGYISQELQYYLSGGNTHIIPLVVNVSANAGVNAFWQNISTGAGDKYIFAFDGNIYVGSKGVGVPVQFSFNWDGKF